MKAAEARESTTVTNVPNTNNEADGVEATFRPASSSSSSGGGSAGSGASAETTTSTRKKKRKCIRLDSRHHRNVFVCMFYRIWMYRRRHLMLTLLQLTLPPLILILMILYLGQLLHSDMKNWTKFDAMSEKDIYGKINQVSGSSGVISCYVKHRYSDFALKFIPELESRFLANNIQLTMLNNKQDMMKEFIHYNLRNESQKFIGGIEIENPPDGAPINGFKLKFSVAMAKKTPGFYFLQRPLFFNLEKNDPHHHYPLLGIQMTIFRSFYAVIRQEVNGTINGMFLPSTVVREPITLELQSLPYPPHSTYSTRKFYESINVEEEQLADDADEADSMLAIIFVLSMIPVCFTVVEGPVTEKENGFKLYLLLMGFSRGAYWFSWILNQLLIQLFVIGLQVFLIFFAIPPNSEPLIRYGSPGLWVVILILFNFCCLAFFVFLAAFFRRGKMATYLILLIWLLSFHLLETHMPSYDLDEGYSIFMTSCLIPSSCIYWAVYFLTSLTSATWSENAQWPFSPQSGFRLSDVIFMMVIDFFIYFFLALYVDNLKPGPLESGQPWNYFFEGIRCRFIDPNKDYMDKHNLLRSGGGVDLEDPAADQDTEDKKPAIEFQMLSKQFRSTSGVVGMENVNFTAYAQRVTVLLGQKDSGRTTLMRLLCGEYSPTAGTAVVFGYNVRKNMQKVQSFFSVCLGHDSLCEYLTVMEHMVLIGKLKGRGASEAKKSAKRILERLDLMSIAKDQMWKLMKWQRRVLCIAMAFMGNAPILLLDEPTKNLDIDMKRQIWSMIMELKKTGRTILMSTSDIEEAYHIADRIVIMSRGRVAGVGKPSRLEDIFETGYHLNLSVTEDADEDKIVNFLQQYVPSARDREGGFTQVKKAMRFREWDQSMMNILTLDITDSGELVPISGSELPKPVRTETNDEDKGESKSWVSRILAWFGIGTSSEEEKKEEKEIDEQKRRDTVVEIPTEDPGFDLNYLMSFGEEDNFPKLFRALETPSVIAKLGIKSYEMKLHDMQKAFNEVDDYVDVLKTTEVKRKTFVDLEDFVDIRGLNNRLRDKGHAESLPEMEEGEVSRWWRSIWAMIVKRVCHMIGNFSHATVQLLAPILILVITVYSINNHFRHRLASPDIGFNMSSTETHSPVVPYRMGDATLSQEFLSSYKTVIRKPPNNLKNLKNIKSSRFEKYFKNNYQLRLHDDLVVAADFTYLDENLAVEDRKVIAVFSPGHYHSSALSMLLMFNTILHYEFPEHGFSVEMTGKSLSHSREWVLLLNKAFSRMMTAHSVDVTLTVSLAFGYFIFTSGFVTQPVSERLNHLKRYQMYALRANGFYWIANAFIDLFFNIIPVILLTIVIYYQPDHGVFKNQEFIILFVLAGTLGGLASILSSYYWSHFLLKPETSFYAVLSINQVLGLFIFLFYTIINFEGIGGYSGRIVFLCLSIIQPFTIPWNFYCAILWGMDNARCAILNPIVKKEMCSKAADGYANIAKLRENCCSDVEPEFSVRFIYEDITLLSNFVILCVHCVLGILLLMLMESRRFRKSIFRRRKHKGEIPELKNQKDVQLIAAEKKLVEEALDGPDRDKLFIVSDLGTATSRRDLLYPMSFFCEAGKCTAVVGPEASGISVLYNIFAGIRAAFEGSVTFGGHSLHLKKGTRKKFLHQMGLSPSKDITIEKMTGLQFIKLFARLRGVSSKNMSTHVDYWVKALELEKVIKARCRHYSVVSKRKLAVILAVIGNPQVVIFDEPIKDLDPVSKYQVFKILDSLIHANRTVIILTHDLSSVEKICSKLIFLVNGQMKFCGSTEDIYKDIANDFTLIVKMKGDEQGKFDVSSYAKLKSEIVKAIEGIQLMEEQTHMLRYQIKHEKATWSTMFENVGKVVAKHTDVVSEYHIRKTSLQDVYKSYSVNQQVFRMQLSAWDEFRTLYC